MRTPAIFLFSLLAIGTTSPGRAVAQESPPAKTMDPLFASHEPIQMGIQADFKKVFKDRDSMEVLWSPGMVRWATDGRADSLGVELTTRGHFRLRSNVCAFPPLRVRFPKETSAGTLWSEAGSIKLATHCRSNYDHITLLEHLSYRLYNLLTDMSFQVRLAQITYRDDGSGGKEETRYAFFIEDADHLAKRSGGKIFDPTGMSFSLADSTQVALMSTFNYMIGFTDWSLPFLHNIRVIERGGGTSYYPVPYDFDWSGLVNAPYARPNPMLNIRHVRQRVWRGPCVSESLLDATLATFNEKREAMLDLIRNQEGLEPKRQEDVIKYLEEFFSLVQDRRKAHREMRGVCS